MSEQGDQTVDYRLARTVVTITGVVTIRTADDLTEVREHVSDIAVAAGADPAPSALLSLVIEKRERHWWWPFGQDRDFDITLAPDERLSAVGVTTTGVGAQILEAGVKVVAFVVSTAAGLAAAPAAEEPTAAEVAEREALEEAAERNVPQEAAKEAVKPRTVDDVFAAEYPETAAQRASLGRATQALQTSFAERAEALAKLPDDTKEKELKALGDALAKARGEAAVFEAQFEAWRALRFPVSTQKLSYTLGVDELPVRDRADDTVTLPQDLSPGVKEAVDKLGVVVAWIGPGAGAEPAVVDPAATDTIRFRRPRPARLAVYGVARPLSVDEDLQMASAEFKLRSLVSAQVVDSRSTVGVIPIRSSLFAQHGTAAEFGETGAMTRLSNKEVGALGIILGGEAGKGKDSADQAVAAQAAAAKPAAPASVDPDLESLQDAVAREELEVKLLEAEAKAARRKVEIKLVEARRSAPPLL